MLIDFSKKFYKQNNDLVVLKLKTAINETVKNILSLSKYDVPMCVVGANIDFNLLKSITHSNAREIVNNIENAIYKIKYVKNVNIQFYYKNTEKNMTIKIDTEHLNESVEMNLELTNLGI
jgi:Icc-related predicted phosphoesterase